MRWVLRDTTLRDVAQHDALADLYTRYQGRLFAFCHYLTGGDAAAAEELTQAAFAALCRRPPPDPSLGWLRAVALNTWRTDRAAARRHPWVPFDPWDPEAVQTAEPADPARVEDGLLRRDGERELRALLDTLAPDYRAVLLLTAAGLSQPAIGARLGRSAGAVKLLLHRARRAAWRALGVAPAQATRAGARARRRR